MGVLAHAGQVAPTSTGSQDVLQHPQDGGRLSG
jgi:hypothetical protein